MRPLLACLFAMSAFAADTIPVVTAPTSISFLYQVNSSFLPAIQSIVVASPERGSATFTASRPIEHTWLLMATASTTTTVPAVVGGIPSLLLVGVNVNGLGLGLYTSNITLRTPNGIQVIPVSLRVTPATVLLTDPGTMFFDSSNYPEGIAPLATIAVGSSNPMVLPFVTSSTATPWLSVRGTGTTVQVSVDRSKVPPGVATGFVNLSANNFQNSLTVPVVFLPRGVLSSGALTLNPTALEFNGSGSQALAMSAESPVEFTAVTAVQGGGNWLTVQPAAGTTPQNLTVCANAAGLAAGTYQGAVSLNTNGAVQTVPVTLTAGAPALPAITRLVNAATFGEGPIAPGEIVTIGGTGLGPACLAGLALDANGRVATTLGGAQVLFNGIAAPLVYAAANVVSAVAPYELTPGANANIQIVVNGQASNTISSPVIATAPGVFTANSSGSGPGAILNADARLNTAGNPADKGSAIVLYVTGEGQTDPSGVNGQVSPLSVNTPAPVAEVSVRIDGQLAAIEFAREAPGFVSGVMQLNVRVPQGIRSGEVPVSVTAGAQSSQTGVTVFVR